MERMHFLDRLEHDVDYMQEYKKLEAFCEMTSPMEDVYSPINENIEQHFWKWNERGTFASFDELRKHMGFGIDVVKGRKYLMATEVDINGYFSFCEMILTLISRLESYFDSKLNGIINAMVKTMQAVVERAGFEFKEIGNEICVVEKNAGAIEVADKVPELADVIIEYNHYLLRGNLDRKKLLLKQIADALEPKRKTLEGINKEQTSNYFEFVNSMNIRHNNLDPTDKGNYNPVFASYSPVEQETWYDLVYEQALMLFMLLEQQERNKRISEYKQARANVK